MKELPYQSQQESCTLCPKAAGDVLWKGSSRVSTCSLVGDAEGCRAGTHIPLCKVQPLGGLGRFSVLAVENLQHPGAAVEITMEEFLLDLRE